MGQNHIYDENALGRGRYRHPLVRRLLAGQFPQWAGLPIEPVQPFGTDNAIYRLGDAMAVRLPRRKRTSQILEEHFSRAIHSGPYNGFFIADGTEETSVMAVRSAWREGGNP